MEPTDLTIEILKDIRTDIRDLRNDVHQTNERLGSLERRIVESEIRTATAIAGLAGAVDSMTDVLRASPICARA